MLRLVCASILLIFCLVVASAQELTETPAVTDGLKHSVEFAELIIDDFENFSDRLLPVSEARLEDVLRARNRIRPFCDGAIAACFPPAYESLADASAWLLPENLVIGYLAADGSAYAFPVKVLTFHELVNDTLAGEPVMVSYNPQSNNMAVYSRRFNGSTLDFGNTSIYYQNISTVYDVQTESLWLTTNGRAIVGEYTDSQLQRLPSVTSTWQEWSSFHPDTLVLSRRPHYVNYEQNLFSEYETRVNLGRFIYPISDVVLGDTRLRYADEVLLLDAPTEVKVYPFEALSDQIVTDTLGGQEIVILSHSTEDTIVTTAFLSQLEDGTALTMQLEAVEGGWRELNSQSMLDYSGNFTGGTLDGHHLLILPSGMMYWFAAVATYPELELVASVAN